MAVTNGTATARPTRPNKLRIFANRSTARVTLADPEGAADSTTGAGAPLGCWCVLRRVETHYERPTRQGFALAVDGMGDDEVVRLRRPVRP